MEFTLDFIDMFAIGLFYAAPLLASMLLVIVVLGHIVGKLERWSRLDAMYYAFITATTVGYGDFHPRRKPSKVLAIAITLVGIIFTGIIVAVALHAGQHAFKETHDAAEVARQLAE
jgi:voltage-gated potassium channel